MSALTNTGRKRLAALLHSETLFVAWGTGSVHWSTNKEITSVFNVLTNLLGVGYTYIADVVVRLASNESIVYEQGADYTFNAQTGVLTRQVSGGIPSGQSVVVAFHVNPPPASVGATSLLAEVGRRRVVNKMFVVPDNEGEIVAESGQFSPSPENAPTNHVYLEVAFLPSEASDQSIREVGVFSQVVTQVGLPGGQLYFTPSQVTQSGDMWTSKNLPTIVRNGTSRETFHFVITL